MPLLLLLLLLAPVSVSAKDLGELSANPYQQNSTANPYGAGSSFAPNGINNPFSPYGSPYSNQSSTDPFATDAPRLYDQQGNYRGNLSANPYDPDSTSNPYGRYGSPYSPDSINNSYGAGSPYRSDSPTNPYGPGLRIEGQCRDQLTHLHQSWRSTTHPNPRRLGNIKATIWQNVSEKGPFFPASLSRPFNHQSGAWRNGS